MLQLYAANAYLTFAPFFSISTRPAFIEKFVGMLLLNCIIDNLTTYIGILFGKAEHSLVILEQNASVKPVSHQPCGSRAPVHVDKFLDFVRQPHGVVYYTARLPYENKVARLPQRVFDMFIFFAICLRFLRVVRQPQGTQGCRKAVARLLQDTQGVRTTDVLVRQPRICLTSVARLPQGNRALYRKAVVRMPQNARLQCQTRTTYRFVLRQSCNFCMTVLR